MYKIDYTKISREEFIANQKKRDEIFIDISRNMLSKRPSDSYVQERIGELYVWMRKSYDASLSIFRGLGEIYEFDNSISEVLKKNYGEGMPKYLAQAIIHFCDNN